ncbi:DUF7695 domain-containing protein [Paenibacillus eucommiae]|uniref:DUF7695 domain-containing protein n=1 Tax=Paenibacillus eucommiae TaxID=1355755 RepID=UPI00406BAE3B
MRILVNKVRCKQCLQEVVSETTHDFQKCKCGKVGVDGGKSYLRRVGELDLIEELSVWEEVDDET